MENLEQALNQLNLSSSQSPDITVRAAHHLAEASKTNIPLRSEIGKPLILQQLVALVDCSLNDSIETTEVALRCIGNACIDNDIARRNITDIGFSWAKRCLTSGTEGDSSLAVLTAKVLYNVCLDFEEAQQQCYRESVHHELISLLGRRSVSSAHGNGDAPLVIELLYLIASQRTTETSDTQSAMDRGIIAELLNLPSRYSAQLSTEDYTMLVGSCAALLRSGEAQAELPRCANNIWILLELNESYIESLRAQIDFDADDEKLLVGLSTDIIWSLSDASASSKLQEGNDTGTIWVDGGVLKAISGGPEHLQDRLFVGACQALGNMLWSTKNANRFAWLVEVRSIQHPLLRALSSSEDAEVLHSAAGVATQLCRPSVRVRGVIAADDSIDSALQRLCRHENPTIKQDGIKFLRALGQECPEIQHRFADLAKEVLEAAASSNATSTGDFPMTDIPG